MLAPDQPHCQYYPCTIRFYSNCPNESIGAEAWYQRAPAHQFPPWHAPWNHVTVDPFLRMSDTVDGEVDAFFADWHLPSDRSADSVHYTELRIFRSGSSVKSANALRLIEW